MQVLRLFLYMKNSQRRLFQVLTKDHSPAHKEKPLSTIWFLVLWSLINDIFGSIGRGYCVCKE